MARTVRPVKRAADAAAYDGEILPGVHLVSSAHTGAHDGRVYLCGAAGMGNRRAATNRRACSATRTGKAARKVAMYTNVAQRAANVADIGAGRRIRADRG